MLVHSAEFGPVVLGRDGLRRLRTGVVIGEDPLAPYGEHAAALVARTSAFPHCADVDDQQPLRPGHRRGVRVRAARRVARRARRAAAAAASWCTRGRSPTPGEIVGAEQLHRVLRGWLTDLGHPVPDADRPPGTPR